MAAAYSSFENTRGIIYENVPCIDHRLRNSSQQHDPCTSVLLHHFSIFFTQFFTNRLFEKYFYSNIIIRKYFYYNMIILFYFHMIILVIQQTDEFRSLCDVLSKSGCQI